MCSFLSVCLSICLSIDLSINQSIYLSNLPIYLHIFNSRYYIYIYIEKMHVALDVHTSLSFQVLATDCIHTLPSIARGAPWSLARLGSLWREMEKWRLRAYQLGEGSLDPIYNISSWYSTPTTHPLPHGSGAALLKGPAAAGGTLLPEVRTFCPEAEGHHLAILANLQCPWIRRIRSKICNSMVSRRDTEISEGKRC